jgi:hypothetical protein
LKIRAGGHTVVVSLIAGLVQNFVFILDQGVATLVVEPPEVVEAFYYFG